MRRLLIRTIVLLCLPAMIFRQHRVSRIRYPSLQRSQITILIHIQRIVVQPPLKFDGERKELGTGVSAALGRGHAAGEYSVNFAADGVPFAEDWCGVSGGG